ncbi:hypothetical protein JVU11DRAFT_2453 [Chiua virens]|nr:hypothetical protein JVU11DRAFT_2453 [Chiua virens]
MSSKIYVGNLSWNTTDDALRQAFSPFGQVLDSIVMRDRDTGRSRGFGFVTYGSPDEASAAISALNEQELDGRRVKVNLANARTGGGGPASSGSFGGAPGGFAAYGGGYAGGQAYGAAPGYGGGFGSQGGSFGYPSGQQGYPGGGYGGYQQQSGGGYGY